MQKSNCQKSREILNKEMAVLNWFEVHNSKQVIEEQTRLQW